MKIISLALLVFATSCFESSVDTNPISKDYPCGTRAHACSTAPTMCCWNFEVCGKGLGCPAGMCCADPDISSSAKKESKSQDHAQWVK